MNSKDYVRLQIERIRAQLRSTSFLRLGNNSLELTGKSLNEFVSDLLCIKNKPIELIDATALYGLDSTSLVGDIVSLDNAFTTNDGMIWNDTNIKFYADNGVYLSPDQYQYLKNQKLGHSQIFAESEHTVQSVNSAWKRINRIVREARNDKAKEILYLSLGELVWEFNKGKKGTQKIKSPLFIMPIKEEKTSSDVCKFRITSPILRQNCVLKREIIKQTGINIYEGCEDFVPLENLETVLEKIDESIKEYLSTMKVDKNIYHICILDSHDESICQAVEKNIDSISSSKLTQMLSGELTFSENDYEQGDTCTVILPLPADESQQKVIKSVMNGQSIYSPAPAGAGKSQTSVNIAANLAIQGKSICVMSEKLAANEVFINYASKIGLDKYCLSVNSDMKTSDIIRQIKSIAKINRQYVYTPLAKETINRYFEAVREYEHINDELYIVDPELKISLYDLISIAVAAPQIMEIDLKYVTKKDYLPIKSALFEINSKCFEVMTDQEFIDYFYNNSCDDLELKTILSNLLNKVCKSGIDLLSIIPQNALNRSNTVMTVLSNIARKLALDTIGENNLYEMGNRKVQSVYKLLLDTHLQMQELYVAYLHQELSARISQNIDDKFISTLEKLRASRITPQELFSLYGEDILKICPIIITTPNAASNYIYGTGLDNFYSMILDEASQMQIISILPYLDKAKQLIIFGDSMQLGITSTFMKKDLIIGDAINDTAYSDRSVLQAAQGRMPSYPLKYHYRSETELLIHVSNKTCYDGLLEVVPDIYIDRESLPNNIGLEIIRVNPPDSNKKGCNDSEALEIAARVEKLIKEYPDKSIGIIAFNERQQELIVDSLEKQLGSYMDSDHLWVRSLENAQGKEADFVLISIGHFRRNQDGSLHKGISEINRVGGENRLNVLFTRARCKNYIVMSFDYNELKKSDNAGIKRLYEYIDYAANGNLNEFDYKTLQNHEHLLLNRIAEMIKSVNSNYDTKVLIGSENMAVDIAIKESGASCYSLGILLPSFRQTPQETLTKLLVLERVGWHISPISPIYFLTANDFFKNQLDKDIKNPISFISDKCSYFITTIKPDMVFTFDEFVSNANGDDVNEITPISEDDFFNMDIKSYYKNILNEELWLKDAKELKLLAKEGNTEANLVLLIILKEKFIREGKLKIMLSNVNRLYAVYKEKRTSFLFAQMLRINNITNNRNLINNLLKEAKELGIGGGNDVD